LLYFVLSKVCQRKIIMLIGVPKEIKTHEYRVGIVPANVKELKILGHEIVIEAGAGLGIGATDSDYIAAGARIADSAQSVFKQAELIVKVKEPQAQERKLLRPGQLLFTYLHLAPDPAQAKDLLASGASCIAYETVTDDTGGLPLLAPMSEIAGRLSIQAGAHFLEKPHGGKGVLLGGAPGVAPAKVVVLGGGVVGKNAIEMAMGLGAEVWVIDRNVDTLRKLLAQFGSALHTLYSTTDAIERHCKTADLLIGGVLLPGAAAPKLITRAIVKSMQAGSVIVDVAIDQGGCCETSHATTHDVPTYLVDGVIHYCVANMPGAVPNTSAYTLNNATLPFIIKLANAGLDALRQDKHLRNGLAVHKTMLTNKPVAEALGYDFVEASKALEI
jgi:alanine dehydrogenase